MLLGARDAGAEAQYGGEADQSCPHDGARKLVPGGRSVTGRENAIKFVNRRLTVRSARSSNFSRVFAISGRRLTARTRQIIVPP